MTNALLWQDAETAAQDVAKIWGRAEPGGVIMGFDKDGTRFEVASGLADLARQEDFSTKSVGRFASISKHIFAAMVLRHPELVSLEDTLGSHVYDLREPLASVTIGQALDMTGGLPDIRECFTLHGLSVYSETSAEANHEFMARQTRLNFEPGTEISYSNSGYRIVELIMEHKGMRFEDFLQREINYELGTALHAPHIWAEPMKHLVPGYWHNGRKWLQSSAGLQLSASGSVTASARDMVKWLQALLAPSGKWPDIFEQLTAPRSLNDGTPTGYGLGMMETVLGDKAFVGHGGSHPGYRSYVLMDRQSGSGVVVLSNREDFDSRVAAMEVMAALHDQPMPELAPDRLPDGYYVASEGPFWLEIHGANANWLSDDGLIYEEGESAVSTRSATSQMHIWQDKETLVGKFGQVERRLHPVKPTGAGKELDGLWMSDEGAYLTIRNGRIEMGAASLHQSMPLRALGGGRYLFSCKDSLWTKIICLNWLEEDHFELVLSRARMVDYRRIG